MKANEVAFKNFLTQNKTQFVIPVYQRNYDWTTLECRQLLYDIIEAGCKAEDDTHFIGSIVFIHEGVYTSSDVRQLVIIDGQQRLTTMTLLYLALYHYAFKNDMEEIAQEINDTILINRFVKEDSSKLKLKQTDINAKAFRFLLNGNAPADYKEYSRLIENYCFFSKNIDSQNFKTILKGLDRLLFVEISLERDKDDPQKIFESLNSTGLALTQADLIRNYILMGLAPKEQVRVFENYWEIIENNAKEEDSQSSRVSDLIRDYLTIINKKIPKKDNVYEEFKAKFKQRNESFYNETLQKIKEYSIIYNKLLNPQNETDKDIGNEIKSIRKLEINVSYPFLIQVYDDYLTKGIDKTTFINVLRLVQSYTWRRFILSLPTNALNKIFMTLFSEVDKADYLSSLENALVRKKGTQRFPDDAEVEAILRDKDMYNIQPKNKSYYFEQMEHFNNPEKVDLSSDSITVEHIFPRNPDASWKSDLTDDDYTLLNEKYNNTIANLTLSGNNGILGNKTFGDKKTMNKDNGRQGYIYSNLWMNEYLKTIDSWGMAEYNNRFKLLLDRFKSIWRYPNTASTDENDEYTVLDAPEPRHRTLDYFSSRDELIYTNEFSKMYAHVITTLFNEQPSKFLLTDLKDTIFLSTDKGKLRSPYAISDTYFIESNLDSNTKFSKLKQVIYAFALEDELVFRYKTDKIG